MSYPFQVGKTYRNRVGEYVVQAIEGNFMKIRYVGGRTLETRISVQARIWENIQFEEQMAREEERMRLAREARQATRKRTARAKRAPAKPEFGGFQESDFEPKKRGIAWSTRKDLGTSLAHELNDRTAGGFGWWIVPRQSEVHIARERYYSRETGETNATLFVAVNEHGVYYGFSVGKPDGKARVKWPWSALLALLSEDGRARRALRAAMKQHELSLDVYAMDVSYGQVGQVVVQDRGLLWRHETAEQEMTRRMNWKGLVEYLQTVGSKKRCNLFFRKHLSPSEALKIGTEVSSEIVEVLAALVSAYDASVGA